MMRLKWLIIGGGIHGVHIAARLLGETDIQPHELRIIDPGERLLERWQQRTVVTGMRHLRSPAVHHLDLDPWSLKQYATKKKTKRLGRFAPPYDRPALRLFNAHCDEVIETFGLNALHLKARAIRCTVQCEGIEIQACDGVQYYTDNIILALGGGETPEWPAWAPRDDARVSHVFAKGFDAWPVATERVLVVGGGISAGQVCLRLMNEGHKVHLASRHPLRQHQFDSDPGWLGPRYMNGFRQEPNADRRREMITDARHKGSVPPDVWRALRRAFNDGRIHWHEADVDTFGGVDDALRIRLSDEHSIDVDRVLLATGFSSKRPGGPLLDALIEAEQLPCAGCGYPIVDASLRWHPHIYVSGPLAELELGPSARNIVGARRAANRLVSAYHASMNIAQAS